MKDAVRFVFKPHIARKLLKLGYQIIDLKPQRQLDGSTDFTRTTFVFAYQNGIDEAIENVVTNTK